jgi:2-deoxy-D-gluconate 3-dehydrogenase
MNVDTRTNPDKTYYKSITDRIPIGRWGDPEEFKGIVVFLASKASSYITGEIIAVSGDVFSLCLLYQLLRSLRLMEVG